MSLWHTDVSVCLSIYLFTIRKCFFSIMHWWIFLILEHNNHQVGDNKGFQEFGIKGHLGVIWSHCSNTLKTLLRLHDSIGFDETWVKKSLTRGSFGVFRNFWSEVILGSFGVTVEGQILNSQRLNVNSFKTKPPFDKFRIPYDRSLQNTAFVEKWWELRRVSEIFRKAPTETKS